MTTKTIQAYMLRAYPVNKDGEALHQPDDFPWFGPVTGVLPHGSLTEVEPEEAAWIARLSADECRKISPFWEIEAKTVEISPWDAVGRIGWRAYAFPANRRDWLPLWEHMSPLIEVAPVHWEGDPPYANNQMISPQQAAELNGDDSLLSSPISDWYIVSLEWVCEQIVIKGL